MSPVRYEGENRLTSEEIMSYLIGVYQSQRSSQIGVLEVRASKRRNNLVFLYSNPGEKHPLELVISALYAPGRGEEPDTISIIPHGVNQAEARRFLEQYVSDDSIFEDTGDLRAFKSKAHTWRNILRRAEISPRENAKTVCHLVNKSADAWEEVFPAIRGYMVQPWIVFLAHHMRESQ